MKIKKAEHLGFCFKINNIGPLGVPSPLKYTDKKVIGVAGGLGAAPIACPVCGSLEHPFPAMFPPDHAERQKQLQQDREEARQAVQQSEQQWQVCRQYLERLKVQLEL